ncbi:MAG: hypothetical protein OXF06_08145 [Bacteroidetes bacterium]|nr:hypothetical protein [Bacteroidota bacterium]MCY4224795.1 hypothetical protein [Bacteroidota bacterium]
MEAESKSTLKREGGQFVRMRGTALRAGIQIFDHVVMNSVACSILCDKG